MRDGRKPTGIYQTTVTSKGQITIPAPVRRYFHIEPGDRVLIEVFDEFFTVKRLPR